MKTHDRYKRIIVRQNRDTAAVIQEGNNAVQSANVLVHVSLVEVRHLKKPLTSPRHSLLNLVHWKLKHHSFLNKRGREGRLCGLHFVDGFQNEAALETQELEEHINPRQTVPRSAIARFSISIPSTTPLRRIRNVEQQYLNKSFMVRGTSSKMSSCLRLLPQQNYITSSLGSCVVQVP
jgi:hypothetical protein